METFTFLSWDQWLYHLDHVKTQWSSWDQEGNEQWSGTRDYQTARERARRGLDATDWILAIDHTIAEIASQKDDVEFLPDIQGLYFDIDAVIKGDPEPWFRAEPEIQMVSKPKVRILINNCASAGVDAKVIESRGKTVFSLAASLDLIGVDTEVWLGYAVTSHNQSWQWLVRLKEFSQQPDYSIVNYALGDISSFRRLGFKAIEEYVSCSACYPCDAELVIDREVEVMKFQRLFLGEQQWTNEGWCLKWIKGECEKYGVTFHS